MSIEKEITGFIAKTCRIPEREIGCDMKIYDSANISSLRLIELLAHIESEYRITIRPEELVEENFRDVGTLVTFVTSKTNQTAEHLQ